MTLTDKELNAILTTLEKIEVHGFDNMNALGGLRVGSVSRVVDQWI